MTALGTISAFRLRAAQAAAPRAGLSFACTVVFVRVRGLDFAAAKTGGAGARHVVARGAPKPERLEARLALPGAVFQERARACPARLRYAALGDPAEIARRGLR